MQGWRTWLSDLQQLLVHGDEAVLVTVARTEGVTPRDTGVKMIVARDRTFHTIGGGPLEWHAVETARRLLREGGHTRTRWIERLAIGGTHALHHADDAAHAAHNASHTAYTVHGGAMTLAYERLTIADLAWVTSLGKRFAAGQASVRTVSFGDDSPVLLSDAQPGRTTADCLLWDAGPLLTETIVIEAFPVMLFGAGHVGKALVRVLATLPCQVTWIDDRPAQLCARPGEELAENIVTEHCAHPAERVATAPAGCHFVVMTYSDALDQDIAERILHRTDYAYLGVIGSHAKRRSLEHLFAARGIDPAQVARMHCPIGVQSLQGNAPEVIAISVAADLLQTREQAALSHTSPS